MKHSFWSILFNTVLVICHVLTGLFFLYTLEDRHHHVGLLVTALYSCMLFALWWELRGKNLPPKVTADRLARATLNVKARRSTPQPVYLEKDEPASPAPIQTTHHTPQPSILMSLAWAFFLGWSIGGNNEKDGT
ncbi:hypothetical protein [endosymbiont of Riftia pachyptila]|uniref:hypothetical protein n=1 Tax=endosymbiont of Riftia pachyptila TaxID=54396 RepID=UPI001112365E|nr:hypothetical protein [endosymbiont of Riftia pachyptila]